MSQGDMNKREFEDLGFAKIDHDRASRKGYPEVIYGAGKTPIHAATIFQKLSERNEDVLCTRASSEMAEAIKKLTPGAIYHDNCGIVELKRSNIKPKGMVAIVSGGTSDMRTAEEAALTLEFFGSKVERIYDAGVAGIHRLLAYESVLRDANCIVAVAGMEGALPSVVAGLVDVPVIAVPTSVGYGASFHGLAALLAMLNSCASGISVVNIDNGFGAAYQADMINKLASSK